MSVKIPIIVPKQSFPKKDTEHPCACQLRPMNLNNKNGALTWLKKIGEQIKEDEVLCEGEVEKKTLELKAPCAGKLVEICILDGENFTYGDTLGYIEKEE